MQSKASQVLPSYYRKLFVDGIVMEFTWFVESSMRRPNCANFINNHINENGAIVQKIYKCYYISIFSYTTLLHTYKQNRQTQELQDAIKTTDINYDKSFNSIIKRSYLVSFPVYVWSHKGINISYHLQYD